MGLSGNNKNEPEPQAGVTVDPNGDITIRARSVPEAKLAIKQLKLIKKELSLEKRSITEKEREIRAIYTDTVRRQGTKFSGGGKVGEYIRKEQTRDRDVVRGKLADLLAPLEYRRRHIEARAIKIDQLIVKLEEYIVRNS